MSFICDACSNLEIIMNFKIRLVGGRYTFVKMQFWQLATWNTKEHLEELPFKT